MKKGVFAAAAFVMACGTAVAQDYTYDPRSLGMGGTGVATSNPGMAAFHNAAMLTSPKDKNDDDFALEMPVIGLRVQDENNMRSDISSLKNNGNSLTNAATAFQNALAQYNATPNATTQAALQTAAQNTATALTAFNNSLIGIDHKTITGNGLIGLLLAVPSAKHGVSFYTSERVELGAQFNFAATDQGTISTLTTNLASCAAGTVTNCQAAGTGFNANGQVNNLASNLFVRGVRVKDFGMAYARQFDSLGGLDIGIVPKISQFTTYDFSLAAQNNPGLALNQGVKGYTAFNLDFGVAKTYATEGGNQVVAGVAVKDVMSKSFVTVLGNTVDVKPRATAGIALNTKLTTLAFDMDLIANQPMISGLVKDSQFMRIGAEFDAWGWAQVRVGYRHDLKGNYVGLPSLGLGLSPFGGVIHIELSAAYASQKEGAISAQLGIRF